MRKRLGGSAEQGDTWGQYELGSLYHNGHGVPQDYVEAYMWYSLALSESKEIDDQIAMDTGAALDELQPLMTREQIAKAKARVSQFCPVRKYRTQK